jgi:ADP-ribose pyrophosphatase YjhB (NUDIX family)
LWTIPGGHRDVGEDPEKTAARELFEETKIVAEKLQLVFAGEIRGDSCAGGADIHFWHAYVYRVPNNVEPELDADEGREWGWFTLDKLPELTMPVGYLLSLSEVRVFLE